MQGGKLKSKGGDSKILKIKFQFYAVIFYISRGGGISPPWLHWENPCIKPIMLNKTLNYILILHGHEYNDPPSYVQYSKLLLCNKIYK